MAFHGCLDGVAGVDSMCVCHCFQKSSLKAMRTGTSVSGISQHCTIRACHSARYTIASQFFVVIELMYIVNVSPKRCQGQW